MNDAETVLLIGSLENQKAIDIHHASPMMKKIHQRLNTLIYPQKSPNCSFQFGDFCFSSTNKSSTAIFTSSAIFFIIANLYKRLAFYGGLWYN
jgi:hypothetical protein